MVGEIALLRFRRRMGTVRVTSPLRAVTVSADDLQVIEEEMPEIAGQLRSIMAAREREIAPRRTDICTRGLARAPSSDASDPDTSGVTSLEAAPETLMARPTSNAWSPGNAVRVRRRGRSFAPSSRLGKVVPDTDQLAGISSHRSREQPERRKRRRASSDS